MARERKSTKGRRKIEMKKIEKEDTRHVCFSKRRIGLFNKASELATLCGAELTIMVNSPVGNPYSFGCPRVSQVVDKFLTSNMEPLGSSMIQEGYQRSVAQQLNEQYSELSNRLQMATDKKNKLQEEVKTLAQENQVCRFAEDIEALGLTELEQLKKSLDCVRGRLGEIMMTGGTSLYAPQGNDGN